MSETLENKPSADAGDARPLVVGLGEALFDCFPDREVLGGAPVNFAVHAHALLRAIGGAAFPATRIGPDALGARYLEELRARDVPVEAVQVDPAAPTGRVLVSIDDHGDASYEFAPDVAWDRLEPTPAWDDLARRCDAVAFGTLAQRSTASRAAIREFLTAATRATRLFDVNLRGDHYSAEVLAESFELANAAKLNAEELDTVSRLLLPASATTDTDTRVQRLCERYGLQWVALTRGPDGATLYEDERRLDAAPDMAIDAAPDADSVGAGDAFCAALLVATTLGWAPARRLDLAIEAGAFVASRAGATPRLPDSLIERLTIGPA